MMNYDELNKIKNSKSICLIGHIDPDTDALASMIVFRDFLKEHFKIEVVDIFAECKTIAKTYHEITENVKININPIKYTTAIMMDSPNLERIGIYKNLFTSADNKIVIDHHATNEFNGDINIVELCSSTCEIVYSILKYFNFKINYTNQGKIYAGIITDTNNFTVGNFSKRTFEIAGECVENINRDEIYNHFLRSNTLTQMQLLALAVKNIKSFNNGEILISHISSEESKLYNASPEDFTGIVNSIATILNSKLVCFIHPKIDGFYVSMRANHNYDVSAIAKNNGGGGHKGAAAYLSNKNLTEIENDILIEFTKLLMNTTKLTKKLF